MRKILIFIYAFSSDDVHPYEKYEMEMKWKNKM